MSYICESCGKSKQFGNNVSFSQRRTKRVWKPNLQLKRINIDGTVKKVKICTQCLRTRTKNAKAAETARQLSAAKTKV